MVIRPATEADIPAVLPVFEAAKAIMRADGNYDQWGAPGFPGDALLLRDIGDASEKVRNINIIGVWDDDADIGRFVGGKGLSEAAWLISKAFDGLFDVESGGLSDIALLIDNTGNGS